MTEPQPSLAAALVAFQATVPTIPKNKTAKIPLKNGGSYSYKYADLADTWSAIREPLAANGLAVTQSLVGGSSGWLGIRTSVWHVSGDFISDVVEVQTDKRSPQEVGSQITYFKRYALSATLGLDTDDDDDGNVAQAATRTSQSRPKPPNPTEAGVARVIAAVNAAGVNPPDAVAWFKETHGEDSLVKCTDVDKLTAAAVHYELQDLRIAASSEG